MTENSTTADVHSIWYRRLMSAADRADREAAKFTGNTPDHRRAEEMLADMALHCRRAAWVFDSDPTLLDEPYETGRFRTIDLLMELARQLGPLLAYACGTRVGCRGRDPERWVEAEALFARAEQLAEAIPRVVPREDHATEAGSRRISRERLAVHADSLAEAASAIHAACGPARLRLAHVDPLVDTLTGIARDLDQHAATLMAEHEATRDALDTALFCRPAE